jgi:hypothetical protein
MRSVSLLPSAAALACTPRQGDEPADAGRACDSPPAPGAVEASSVASWALID